MFWDGKPLTSRKKGSWAHGTGSHVFWNGKPLSNLKMESRAQDRAKPQKNAGAKSKVQVGHRDMVL